MLVYLSVTVASSQSISKVDGLGCRWLWRYVRELRNHEGSGPSDCDSHTDADAAVGERQHL
eukprot:COSAG01_NODE_7806_length_3049_cov_3.068475_1_plen_60_part_10